MIVNINQRIDVFLGFFLQQKNLNQRIFQNSLFIYKLIFQNLFLIMKFLIIKHIFNYY